MHYLTWCIRNWSTDDMHQWGITVGSTSYFRFYYSWHRYLRSATKMDWKYIFIYQKHAHRLGAEMVKVSSLRTSKPYWECRRLRSVQRKVLDPLMHGTFCYINSKLILVCRVRKKFTFWLKTAPIRLVSKAIIYKFRFYSQWDLASTVDLP